MRGGYSSNLMRTAPETRPPLGAPRRPRAGRLVHVVGTLGRLFVAGGLLLLFFTGYLLWGTGVYTRQEQQRAVDHLAANPIVTEQKLAKGKVPPARPTTTPNLGDPLFAMTVPKIGLNAAAVFGVRRDDLRKGPGLFPDCDEVATTECVSDAKYPGEPGNVAMSGHRTTYGAPFFRLNELAKGDTIDFISGRARYRYRVREQLIVTPDRFDVVEQHGRNELTLTTCNPRFSAAQRLIVYADYEGASLVSAPKARAGRAPVQPRPLVTPDVLILVSVAVTSALSSLALSKRYRAAAVYAAFTIVGAAGLWVGVFPRVLALMPANY